MKMKRRTIKSGPDYTGRKTQKGFELSLSEDLKEKLFPKSSMPLGGQFIYPEPKPLAFDAKTCQELQEMDLIKSNLRSQLTGLSITHAKLVIRQLYLEFRDFPETTLNGMYTAAPVRIPRPKDEVLED